MLRRIFIGLNFIIFTFIFCFSQNMNDNDITSHIITAAEKGDLKAQRYLVINYLEGRNGFKKNVKEAYKWSQILAENGDEDAQYLLASDETLKPYVENKGQGQIFWLEQAALHSHPKALEEYGVYLFNKKEFAKAVPFLRKAVMEAKGLYSLYLLAQIDYNGLGTEPNIEMAIQEYNAVIRLSESLEISNDNQSYIIPDFVFDSYNQLAKFNAEQNDFQKAIKYITTALDKTTWNKNTLRYVSLLDTRATIYLYSNQTKKCNDDWNNILRLYPQYAQEANTFLTNIMTGNVDYLIPETNQKASHTFALIVANEHYKRVPNVPHAINDGFIFKKYANKTFGIPKENIEYLEDASLNDIKYALNNISQKCEAFKDQCSVIIYYAGHGIPDDKTNEAFLLPVDGFGTDPSSGLNLNDFYTSLSEMPAKSIVVILDACFSGTKRDGGMLMATRGIAIKPKTRVPDGKLIVLSATANDETAFPIEQQKHGLFTYTLLRKIQESEGDITWGELMDYVTETVKVRSIDLNGKLQTPTVAVSPSIKDTWKNLKLR